MTERVEAVFDCQSNDGEVHLECTYDSEKWKAFTESTPYGEITMVLDEDAPARDFFEPGATYRVTFERVDE